MAFLACCLRTLFVWICKIRSCKIVTVLQLKARDGRYYPSRGPDLTLLEAKTEPTVELCPNFPKEATEDPVEADTPKKNDELCKSIADSFQNEIADAADERNELHPSKPTQQLKRSVSVGKEPKEGRQQSHVDHGSKLAKDDTTTNINTTTANVSIPSNSVEVSFSASSETAGGTEMTLESTFRHPELPTEVGPAERRTMHSALNSLPYEEARHSRALRAEYRRDRHQSLQSRIRNSFRRLGACFGFNRG